MTYIRKTEDEYAIQGNYGQGWVEAKKRHPYAEHWTGNIKDLVAKVRYSDARYSAIDTKSGAHIRLNLDSDFMFYIASPDGENQYDAMNMREATKILSVLRRHEQYYE